MKRIDSNLKCPSCSEALRPVQLACDHCGIKVEGPFQLNEFATLAPEDLHFLRIFVRSEGRVREMETALGLSYPTIRTRLTALKNKLQGDEADSPNLTAQKSHQHSADAHEAGQSTRASGSASENRVREILGRLQAGEIPFEIAMKEIKKVRAS